MSEEIRLCRAYRHSKTGRVMASEEPLDEKWPEYWQPVSCCELCASGLAGLSNETLDGVAKALAYALNSVLRGDGENPRYEGFNPGRVAERLITQEFWHSLNRKGLPSYIIENMIHLTDGEEKKLRYPEATPIELQQLF